MKNAISNLSGSDGAALAYQKMLSAFVGERDISGQEVCHILFGSNLVRSSRKYRNLPVMMELSEEVDFDSGSLQNTAMLDHYLKRSQETEELQRLTLWEFAQNWDWKGQRVYKRGQRQRQGQDLVKPYIVRVQPRYQPNQDNEEEYEKYCYAKMILHHPFKKTEDNASWQNTLKARDQTWKAAYHSTCLGDPTHQHPDDTLPTVSGVPDQDSCSESDARSRTSTT